MGKLKKIDFIISENDYRKVIFRFYPRSSNCHSYSDIPPKTWQEVYKVYYHYKIICKYKLDNEITVLFDSGVDECSIIDEVASRLKLLAEGKTKHTWIDKNNESHSIKLLNDEIFPFGDGVSWVISRLYKTQKYSIMLFDYQNVGYRFVIEASRLKEFADYLEQCCEHMLENGDPI